MTPLSAPLLRVLEHLVTISGTLEQFTEIAERICDALHAEEDCLSLLWLKCLELCVQSAMSQAPNFEDITTGCLPQLSSGAYMNWEHSVRMRSTPCGVQRMLLAESTTPPPYTGARSVRVELYIFYMFTMVHFSMFRVEP